MPRSKPTQRQRVLNGVRERGWSFLGGAEWTELRAMLPDVSESTIRDAVRAAGIDLALPWRGVQQHTFVELESSLRGLAEIYAQDSDSRQYCRNLVIEAKNRARWAATSQRVDSGKRTVKAEMVEWMLIWLGDPSLFPAWVELRNRYH